MKQKLILMVFGLIFMTSLIACSQTVDCQNTPEPSETLLIEQTPSPTPKPTISEEEKEKINRFNELMNYCKEYNDWSASILIKDMYDNGEITKDQFYQIFSIDAFSDAKDFDEELWTKIEEHVENLSEIINGKLNKLSNENFKQFCKDLSKASEQGTLYINLFDSKEKIDRVITGVSFIDKWIKDMNDDDFKSVEETFESNALSPGETILLYYHIYSNPKLLDKIESLDTDILTDYFNTACDQLLALNNS